MATTTTNAYWCGPGQLAIRTVVEGPRKKREEVDLYAVVEVASQMGGVGFGLTRLTVRRGEAGTPAEPYHVLLDGPHGDQCDCPGFARWGYCKHPHSLREAGIQIPGR